MHRILFLLVAVLIAEPGAAQDKLEFPKGAPPQFVMVAGFDPAKDVLLLQSAQSVPVLEAREEKREEERVVEGKTIKVPVTVTVYKMTYKITYAEIRVPMTRHQAMEASGKILMGWKQVKVGSMVLLSHDMNVDPAYRKLLAKDTIIIVPRPPEMRKDKKS
jgi:hypothetical protein